MIEKEETKSQKTYVLESLIEWKSDCKYVLTFKNSNSELTGQKKIVEILRIEGKIAYCKSTFELMPKKETLFKMKKID